jgi:hypothetical protein
MAFEGSLSVSQKCLVQFFIHSVVSIHYIVFIINVQTLIVKVGYMNLGPFEPLMFAY